MDNIHRALEKHSSWYAWWHREPHHKKVHWGIFILVVLVITLLVVAKLANLVPLPMFSGAAGQQITMLPGEIKIIGGLELTYIGTGCDSNDLACRGIRAYFSRRSQIRLTAKYQGTEVPVQMQGRQTLSLFSGTVSLTLDKKNYDNSIALVVNVPDDAPKDEEQPAPGSSWKEAGKRISLPAVGSDASQYSPWVMHEPGWASYLMYYCKNTPINGVYRDRVWRAESWGDGKTNFTNDQVVIEGQLHAQDDLSCSPGVVIQGNKWHMYYVTADRDAPSVLYLNHAVADAPGVVWQKKGPVAGIPQPFQGFIDTPSPMIQDGNIVLYFVGGSDQRLYKISSADGDTFSAPVAISSPQSSNGRVTYSNGIYYFVYSSDPSGPYVPPTAIYLSTSTDGNSFPEGRVLFTAAAADWDSKYTWSPYLLNENNVFSLYYAGTAGTEAWWGIGSSLGVRWFVP